MVDAAESVASPSGKSRGEDISTGEGFSVCGRSGCPSGISSETEGFADGDSIAGGITLVDGGSVG